MVSEALEKSKARNLFKKKSKARKLLYLYKNKEQENRNGMTRSRNG